MRRNNTRPIGEVLNEYVEAFKLKGKLNEVALLKAWPEVVGENIARHTKDIKIQNKILYVKIQSSIIRQEIMMIRNELVKRLNEKAGETVVNEMILY